MVYGRLITFTKKTAKAPFTALAMLLAFVSLASSCQEALEAPSSGKRDDSLNGNFYYTGKGYVYESNPIIASGYANLSYPSMKDYVSAKVVTTNSYLETPCFFQANSLATTTSDCFRVFNDVDSISSPLQANNGGWNYPIGSDEFYQINSFYHVNKVLTRFYEALAQAHSNVHYGGGNLIPPATKFDMENTLSFWLAKGLADPSNPSSILGVENSTLNVFSKCYLDPFNAYYSPAENKLCLGWNEQRPFLYAAQDPSVIYHEMGHVLVKVMMNQRNVSYRFPNYYVTPYKSELGDLFYDEGKAINEGISDWFSYFITGRSHFGEWALGRFFKASRAMTEDDGIHKGLVSKLPGERLSYPHYVYYNPNQEEGESEDANNEDAHYAGQIVSHYLVSLTEELKSCSAASDSEARHKDAGNLVLMLLNETLAELGDMSAKGTDVFDQFRQGLDPDMGAFFVNLNSQESYRWGHQVNPPNFRKFFQTFAKNIHYKISSKLCPSFSTDESEQLLDEYGLLLFNEYGDMKKGVAFTDMGTYVDKTLTDYASYFYGLYTSCAFWNPYTPVDNYCPLYSSTQINELNRRNTVLVSKDYLEFPTDRDGVSPVYILDSRPEIEKLLATLTFEGKNVQTSEGSAGAEYNNNNIKISPGEIVGLTLNLFNNSNSPIGGVQILANDWDHMKLHDQNDMYVNRTENRNAGLDTATWAPCKINGWPTENENGMIDDVPSSPVEGDCGFTSRDNFVMDENSAQPKYLKDAPQPICMVQYSSDNETQWVSQDFYRRTVLGLDADQCLNSPSYSGDDFNPNECLIRFLPGAEHAMLGKIDPQKAWSETLTDASSASKLTVQQNNLTLMEVNKRISPGTSFACRFRARFTNCSDCFQDPDSGEDYADYEMIGEKPFKVIDFKFTVVN